MIAGAILQYLNQLEPDATFSGSPPRISSSTGRLYFVKLGTSQHSSQWEGEAESLRIMYEAAPGLVPRLLSFAVEDGNPCFISEYKDISRLSSSAATVLAKRLATELHAKTSTEGFGFGIPTYCGATKLKNGWFQTWHECYASMIQDLLEQLGQKRGYPGLCQKGQIVCTRVIPKLLGSLDVRPVILHGDLWSGNAGVDSATGEPVIYDPASYFGHNEADLSIARIFGGFPESFFSTYHKYKPKSEPVDQYELRMALYELFHYLNHTLLFGGGYAGSAERKMEVLLAAESSLG